MKAYLINPQKQFLHLISLVKVTPELLRALYLILVKCLSPVRSRHFALTSPLHVILFLYLASVNDSNSSPKLPQG